MDSANQINKSASNGGSRRRATLQTKDAIMANAALRDIADLMMPEEADESASGGIVSVNEAPVGLPQAFFKSYQQNGDKIDTKGSEVASGLEQLELQDYTSLIQMGPTGSGNSRAGAVAGDSTAQGQNVASAEKYVQLGSQIITGTHTTQRASPSATAHGLLSLMNNGFGIRSSRMQGVVDEIVDLTDTVNTESMKDARECGQDAAIIQISPKRRSVEGGPQLVQINVGEPPRQSMHTKLYRFGNQNQEAALRTQIKSPTQKIVQIRMNSIKMRRLADNAKASIESTTPHDPKLALLGGTKKLHSRSPDRTVMGTLDLRETIDVDTEQGGDATEPNTGTKPYTNKVELKGPQFVVDVDLLAQNKKTNKLDPRRKDTLHRTKDFVTSAEIQSSIESKPVESQKEAKQQLKQIALRRRDSDYAANFALIDSSATHSQDDSVEVLRDSKQLQHQQDMQNTRNEVQQQSKSLFSIPTQQIRFNADDEISPKIAICDQVQHTVGDERWREQLESTVKKHPHQGFEDYLQKATEDNDKLPGTLPRLKKNAPGLSSQEFKSNLVQSAEKSKTDKTEFLPPSGTGRASEVAMGKCSARDLHIDRSLGTQPDDNVLNPYDDPDLNSPAARDAGVGQGCQADEGELGTIGTPGPSEQAVAELLMMAEQSSPVGTQSKRRRIELSAVNRDLEEQRDKQGTEAPDDTPKVYLGPQPLRTDLPSHGPLMVHGVVPQLQVGAVDNRKGAACSPRGKLEQNMRRVKELHVQRGETMYKAQANFKKERLYLDTNYAAETSASNGEPKTGRAFKRKADVPSFSTIRRNARREVEREQMLKKIASTNINEPGFETQNEVAVQTACLTSPALIEEESSSVVYKELVTREVCFDKDAKIERSSRRTSVAMAQERRSSLRHGSSAMGRRSSHLPGVVNGGKDKSEKSRTGSFRDFNIGLPRKRSQVVGGEPKKLQVGSQDHISFANLNIGSPISTGKHMDLHLEKAEARRMRHASNSPMTMRLQRVLEMTYKVRLQAEPEPVQRLNVAGSHREVSVHRSRALLASLSPERRFNVHERQQSIAQAKIQREQRMLWRRLRKECRALIRRQLKFDETIWTNYDTLVHQYNLERSDLDESQRMGRAVRPFELLRRISKARSENFRLVPPFRLLLNEKRSDSVTGAKDTSLKLNKGPLKRPMNPVRILSELTHRFYNEELPKSPNSALMSPRSSNSGGSFKPQVPRRQILEKSLDEGEEWHQKLGGLLLVSGFGSTFQRSPSRIANHSANMRGDLDDVGSPLQGLPFLPLGQPLDLAQLTAIYHNLMGFDMLHSPHIEQQLQQCQLQLMNAIGARPRDRLNPIYEDEVSQENTMQHESVKVQAHLPRTQEGSPIDSQRVQTGMTNHSFAPLLNFGRAPTDASPEHKMSTSKEFLAKSTLHQSKSSHRQEPMDSPESGCKLEQRSRGASHRFSQRVLGQLNQPSQAAESGQDAAAVRMDSPVETVPATAVLSATQSNPRSEHYMHFEENERLETRQQHDSMPVLSTFLTQAAEEEAAALRQSEPVKVLLGSPARTDFGSAFSSDVRNQAGDQSSNVPGARDQLRGTEMGTFKMSNASQLKKTQQMFSPNMMLHGHQIAGTHRVMSITGNYGTVPAQINSSTSGHGPTTNHHHEPATGMHKKPRTAVPRQYRTRRLGKTCAAVSKPPSVFGFSDCMSRQRPGIDARQRSGVPTTAMRSSERRQNIELSGPSARELARVSGEKMKLQQYKNREISQQAHRKIASTGVASKVSIAELNKRPDYTLGPRATRVKPVIAYESSRSNVEMPFDATKPASMKVLQQQVSAGLASDASFVRINEHSDSGEEHDDMPTSQTPILDAVLPQKPSIRVAVSIHATESSRLGSAVPLLQQKQQLRDELTQEMQTLFTTAGASDLMGTPSATEKVRQMESLLFADMDKPRPLDYLGPVSSRSKNVMAAAGSTYRAEPHQASDVAILLLSKNASSPGSSRVPLTATSANSSLVLGNSVNNGMMSTRQYTEQYAIANRSHLQLRTQRELPALTSRVSLMQNATVAASSYRELQRVKESAMRDAEDELFGQLRRQELGISRRAERRMKQSLNKEAEMSAVQAEHQRMNQKTFLAVRRYDISSVPFEQDGRVHSARLKEPGSRARLRRAVATTQSGVVSTRVSKQGLVPPSGASQERMLLVHTLSDRITNIETGHNQMGTRDKVGWLEDRNIQNSATLMREGSKDGLVSGTRSRLKGLSSLSKNAKVSHERSATQSRFNVDLDHVKRGSDIATVEASHKKNDQTFVEVLKGEDAGLSADDHRDEIQLGTIGQASTVERLQNVTRSSRDLDGTDDHTGALGLESAVEENRSRQPDQIRMPTAATVTIMSPASGHDNTYDDVVEVSPERLRMNEESDDTGPMDNEAEKRHSVFKEKLTFSKARKIDLTEERPPSTLRKGHTSQIGTSCDASPFGLGQRLEHVHVLPSGAQTGTDCSPEHAFRGATNWHQTSFAQGTLFRTSIQQSTHGLPDTAVIAKGINILTPGSEGTSNSYSLANHMAQQVQQKSAREKPNLIRRGRQETAPIVYKGSFKSKKTTTNLQDIMSINSSSLGEESKVYGPPLPKKTPQAPQADKAASPLKSRMATLLHRTDRVFAVKDQLIMSGRSNENHRT